MLKMGLLLLLVTMIMQREQYAIKKEDTTMTKIIKKTDRGTLEFPKEEIVLTTQLGLDQDQRIWNYHESVRVIRILKKRTAAYHIFLGLELHWAWLHIDKIKDSKKKQAKRQQYLNDIDMDKSAVSRFRGTATRYMVDAGIIASPEKDLITMETVALAHDEALKNVATLQHTIVDGRAFWSMQPYKKESEGESEESEEPVDPLDEIDSRARSVFFEITSKSRPREEWFRVLDMLVRWHDSLNDVIDETLDMLSKTTKTKRDFQPENDEERKEILV